MFSCSVVVVLALFLVFTVLESSRKEQIYKSSVLTDYFYKVVGIDGEEIVRLENQVLERKGRQNMYYELEEAARGVHVRLKRSNDGTLQFVKDN